MNKSFYRRTLPEPPAIAFSSAQGRQVFLRATQSGHMERFFPLCEQFRTQDEPSFCGISTLAMVLNAMGQDPGRTWKGPWRYFHEDMLTCCVPLEVVKEEGINFSQMECLARCNAVRVEAFRADDPTVTVDMFRERVRAATGIGNEFLVVSYGRAHLGQSGDGHFSPIGGYDPSEDLVLIMDVARFKYPPHWVKLPLLFEAMKLQDSTTGRARGFMVLTKENSNTLLFVVSTRNRTSWLDLLQNVGKYLKPLCSNAIGHLDCDEDSIESMASCVASQISPDVIGLLDTYTNEFGLNYITPEHKTNVEDLLNQIRQTSAFQILSRYREQMKSTDPIAVEVVTILVLSLPRSTWEDASGHISPCAQRFALPELPEPLLSETKALRRQLQALLVYCDAVNCSTSCCSSVQAT
ncbi:glutathione gamma-glutamylcysteinyltransferase [Plasmodiophora brassicae]